MSRPRLPALLLLSAALCGAAGCSFKRLVANNMASSLADSKLAFEREGSPRHAREASPALLKMLDGFIVSSPENEDLLLQGAEMNATFAFGFIEEEDPAWARELYRKSLDYARRALVQEDASLAAALDGDDEGVRRAVARVEAQDEAVPALFWTAFAWGGLVNVSRSDSRAVADLPKVVAMMERLVAIAPGFFNAGPHLFLGVYYGSRGSMLGGDARKSRAHLAEARRITRGRFPLVDVLDARFGCVALGEKDPATARSEFRRLVAGVLATPDDIDPDNRLATALAKERARKLEGELDDLILPPLEDEPVIEETKGKP